MAILDTYDVNDPADTELEGYGAQKIRALAAAVKAILELDHQFDKSLDTTDPKCNGYHNKLTMAIQASDLSILTDGVVCYSKLASETITGTTTNGSAVVTGITDTMELQAGMSITGTGIPASTTIDSVDSPTQITLSANATADGTPTLTCSSEGFYFRNSAGILRLM